MKRFLTVILFAALAVSFVVAQTPAPSTRTQAAKASSGQENSVDLERVLSDMDKAAASFRTAQADFVWDQFSKVVNDHDLQKGTVYYRRLSKEVQMAADITDPSKKYVLFSGGKVDVYQPDIEQVTEYNAGKNKAEFESFLVLGFGRSGHDLQKSFDVRFSGNENINGVNAAKLELAPKAARVRNMFSQIILWIDPARGISVQQQFLEPSGDYRLAKYSNIKVNEKLSDSVFKLKTTGKTKIVRPQG